MKAKAKSERFASFENALRSVLQVSKAEMKERLENDNRKNAARQKRGPKPSSGRAVS
jgi:hypothetical protein